MPIYQYQCNSCSHVWDEFKKMDCRNDPIDLPCPTCDIHQPENIHMMMNAPKTVDPRKLAGHLPIDRKLQDKFRQIHENTHGSTLDTTSTITKI